MINADPSMNEQPPANSPLPTKLRSEIDFTYIEALPDSKKRAAAYYEYAREAPELHAIARAIQTAGKPLVWAPDGIIPEFNPRIPPEMVKQFTERCDVFPIHSLVLLFEAGANFPDLPFRDARHHMPIMQYEEWPDFSGDPIEVPWGALPVYQRQLVEGGGTNLDRWIRGFETLKLHLISIHWDQTDDELTEKFRKLIPRLRPKSMPEPRRAGRGGRASGSGIKDILNQLAAYRLKKQGLSYESASRHTTYQSFNGWKKAIATAENRIANITKRPFLKSDFERQVGN